MKNNEEKYDIFYSQIYDLVMEPKKSADFIMKRVIKLTKPSKSKDTLFLDAGCGTGYLVNQLNQYRYPTIGIDRSKSMIDYAKSKYPDINVSIGDLEEPMTFNAKTFTHIICNQKTIYEIKEKIGFFRNCHHWLVMDGFFIIELNDTISNISNANTTNRRFGDFQYKTTIQPIDETIVLFTEKFTDLKSSHVRENEQTYYTGNIVQDIIYCGFTEYNQIKGEEGSIFYIFTKNP
jgi:SAM-dependent methyltransferase